MKSLVDTQFLTRYIEFIFIGLPKRLLVIGKRFLILTNYNLSFTLHLRLILVPLYADYTKVGRIIGFVFRLLAIIAGAFVLVIFSVLVILSPLFWYIFLFFFIYYLAFGFFVCLVLGFVVWYLYNKNKPFKRGDFRPFLKQTIDGIKIRGNLEVKDFLVSKDIKDILLRLELNKTDFSLKLLKICSYEFCLQNVSSWEGQALNYQKEFDSLFVEPEYLFLAILQSIPNMERFLAKYNLVFDDFLGCVKWLVIRKDAKEKIHFWQDYYKVPIMGGIGKGLMGRVTPDLDLISTDFTKQVKHGLVERTYWRNDQIKRLADLLGGSTRNVLIIGDPGCGKTGIVKGMAWNIIMGTGFEQLKFKRIVSLEVGKLVAGTKTPGDIADRLKKALEDALGSRDIIIFVDDIHNLISGYGNEDAKTNSAYTVLTNYLVDGRLQFIGATNIENYRKYIEPNASFAQLFQILEIPPSSKEETLEIIKVKAENAEEMLKIKTSFLALKKIVELGDKLVHTRVFPDKAVEIFNRCVAEVKDSNKFVNVEVVLSVMSEITHIPVTAVSQEESQKLLNIESEMKKRVIGQDEAIGMIGSALRRARVGIRNEKKPIASFLFVGTTGVGKTETAKTLARIYFGDEKFMIRLDMSEYQQLDSIERLIGSPNGATKGLLTEAVRNRPFSLILLDEIEKAHHNILLIFLQVLDDGRLTDSSGIVVDFTNTIIIATSNVGTRSIQEVFSRGGSFDEMKQVAMKDVREKFAPEFLNRFTGIIVYRPLSLESVRKIALLMLEGVRKNLEAKGIKVEFKPELVEELLKRGYSPEWGARPMARLIEESVMDYLAVKILSKEIVPGDVVELGVEVFGL